jgi:hypothetical protein
MQHRFYNLLAIAVLEAMESDVAAVADDLGADLDQLLAGWSATTVPPSWASPASA